MELSGISVVALATVGIGLISLLNQLTSGMIARKKERRALAVETAKDYYAPDHYNAVLTRVYQIILRLRSLEGDALEEYRSTIARGWSSIDVTATEQLADLTGTTGFQGVDPAELHYRTRTSTGNLTEHEALTVFMYFWLRLSEMLREDLLDRKVTARLMRRAFPYFEELCTVLFADGDPKLKRSERWPTALASLRKLFR